MRREGFVDEVRRSQLVKYDIFRMEQWKGLDECSHGISHAIIDPEDSRRKDVSRYGD